MSESKDRIHPIDETTTTPRLPNIDIEIVHRRAPRGDAEQLLINVQAAPSFAAFGRFLESANPFAVWTQASRRPCSSGSTRRVSQRFP